VRAMSLALDLATDAGGRLESCCTCPLGSDSRQDVKYVAVASDGRMHAFCRHCGLPFDEPYVWPTWQA
jgi:hypothetical protein